MLAIKIAKYTKNSDNPKAVTTLTKEQVENIVSDYIKLHPEELLDAVTRTYYEKYIGEEKSNKINNPAALQKTKIKKRTECTGFRERITMTPDMRAILEKR